MPLMFGAHNFYNLNGSPILALSQDTILNTNMGMNCPIAHSNSAYFIFTGKG